MKLTKDCPRCGGTGETWESDPDSSYSWKEECRRCWGEKQVVDIELFEKFCASLPGVTIGDP